MTIRTCERGIWGGTCEYYFEDEQERFRCRNGDSTWDFPCESGSRRMARKDKLTLNERVEKLEEK